MYSTRHLSRLLHSQESLSIPPDGPNSGYLVIKDEEAETYSCFGCCKRTTLYDLPLPQNKELIVTYVVSSGQATIVYQNPVFLVPVLNHPLSSNLYYAIDAKGDHIGEAFTCSTEDDKANCCFIPYIKDVKQRPLNPQNAYQQFEIVEQPCCGSKSGFFAKSIAPDGFPPIFLRRKGWTIASKSTKNFQLEQAHGLDSKLRSQLPTFDFPLSHKASNPNVVGKWYSPFVFIKEGTLTDQAKRSPYYEITLEQRWEKIFSCRKSSINDHNKNSVMIDALVEKEEAFVNGVKARWDETNVVEGLVWFTSDNNRVGLRRELVERMRWEQQRGGYVQGNENQAKIHKIEDATEGYEWNEFGCYMLVERFNYMRMDGTLVLSCDFKYTHQIKSKWE